jgi:hypothetical protein
MVPLILDRAITGFMPWLSPHTVVMVALVATIHAFFGRAKTNDRQRKSWMVGTRPTMAVEWNAILYTR